MTHIFVSCVKHPLPVLHCLILCDFDSCIFRFLVSLVLVAVLVYVKVSIRVVLALAMCWI